MNMFQPISCRLCSNICNDYYSLYDEYGRRNEVYERTATYFSPLFLDMEYDRHLTVICMECWSHIYAFHTFQLSILMAQRGLNQRTETVVIADKDRSLESECNTPPPETMQTETVVISKKDGSPESSGFNTPPPESMETDVRRHDSEVETQSEEDFTNHSALAAEGPLYTHELNTNLPESKASPGSEAFTKNTYRGSFSCDEESEESQVPDEEWEEFDDPVGVFAGGEFDEHKHKTNESTLQRLPESQVTGASISSDENLSLASVNKDNLLEARVDFETANLNMGEVLIYTCPFCQKTYERDYSFSAHLNTVHRQEWQEKKKEIREAKRKERKEKKKEIREAKRKERENYKCTTCAKVCKNRSNLRDHMSCHTGERLYRCQFCPNTYRFSNIFYAHVKKDHRQEWEEKRKGKEKTNLNKTKDNHGQRL